MARLRGALTMAAPRLEALPAAGAALLECVATVDDGDLLRSCRRWGGFDVLLPAVLLWRPLDDQAVRAPLALRLRENGWGAMWIPTDDWSGRLLTLGVALALAGLLVTTVGDAVRAVHAISRPVAWVLGTTAGGAGFVAILLGMLGLESERRRTWTPFGRFYRGQMAGLWLSMPPLVKFAFAVVAPITTMAFVILAWLSVSVLFMVAVVGSGLLAFAVLLTIAARQTP